MNDDIKKVLAAVSTAAAVAHKIGSDIDKTLQDVETGLLVAEEKKAQLLKLRDNAKSRLDALLELFT